MLGAVFMTLCGGGMREHARSQHVAEMFQRDADSAELTLFLSGDVMIGRGIDQILPQSVPPVLREPYVESARTYVRLAENVHGPIPGAVSADYIWGDALHEMREVSPDVRIVNLETSVTTSDDWWAGKHIHYRMHPRNVDVLLSMGIDVCVLGNNHVGDFGRAGLEETIRTLQQAGLLTTGAGLNARSAAAPAIVETATGRLLVFSYGATNSGVPVRWAAEEDRSGVNLLSDLNQENAAAVIENIIRYRRQGDRIVLSLHWGTNWGYRISRLQRDFAHRLIDAGAADVIHGHSSHHPRGIEVYNGRLILYGCGELINDYEGIGGREHYRSDLVLMYFPRLDSSGKLTSLEMAPMRIRRFRLNRAAEDELAWLTKTTDRECRRLGSRVELTTEARLRLLWDS